jgi:hypothetical protein
MQFSRLQHKRMAIVSYSYLQSRKLYIFKTRFSFQTNKSRQSRTELAVFVWFGTIFWTIKIGKMRFATVGLCNTARNRFQDRHPAVTRTRSCVIMNQEPGHIVLSHLYSTHKDIGCVNGLFRPCMLLLNRLWTNIIAIDSGRIQHWIRLFSVSRFRFYVEGFGVVCQKR